MIVAWVAVAATLLAGFGTLILVALYRLGATLGTLTESVDNLTDDVKSVTKRVNRVESVLIGTRRAVEQIRRDGESG